MSSRSPAASKITLDGVKAKVTRSVVLADVRPGGAGCGGPSRYERLLEILWGSDAEHDETLTWCGAPSDRDRANVSTSKPPSIFLPAIGIRGDGHKPGRR